MILGFIYGVVTTIYMACLVAWYQQRTKQHSVKVLIVLTIIACLAVISATQIHNWLT